MCTQGNDTTTCSTSVAVTFDELVTTVVGQTVYIVGNTTALGSWAPASGVALSAAAYTSADPLWYVKLVMTAGTAVEYKFVTINESGTVTWEGGSNRVYPVPGDCVTAATVSDTWQS